MTLTVEIPRQDRIQAHKTEGRWHIEAIGCLELLTALRSLSAVDTNPEHWPLPTGTGHVDLLLSELILKTRGEWQFPVIEEELCHCRSIQTCVVDRAIMNGARTGVSVTRRTGASTGCGTCRPKVEQIIDYRLNISRQMQKKAA